jgi:hypothetical protein
MDLTSWLGTFTLERILGTVPVEADGSAYFEVPAGRPVFFVALDANDLSVKRMQSFTNVMPGDAGASMPSGVRRPPSGAGNSAVRRPASRSRLSGTSRRADSPTLPLTRRCVACHSDEDPQGHVRSPGSGRAWSISYQTLVAAGQSPTDATAGQPALRRSAHRQAS